MIYLGAIIKNPDPPGINKDGWIALIHQHPNLSPPPPNQIINPFTKQPALIRPASTTASIVVDGQEIGVLDWSQDESNAIQVSGDWPAVETVVLDVAKRLGGRFERCKG